jgi:hypothetical protein
VLKILFVGSPTEAGGAEHALHNLVRAFPAETAQAFYASLEFGNGPFPAMMETAGAKVFRLPRGRFRQFGHAAGVVLKLAQIIRRERIDVIVANGGHPLIAARPAALLARRPCVWWVHGYNPADPLHGVAPSYAQRLLSADLFIANSQH